MPKPEIFISEERARKEAIEAEQMISQHITTEFEKNPDLLKKIEDRDLEETVSQLLESLGPKTKKALRDRKAFSRMTGIVFRSNVDTLAAELTNSIMLTDTTQAAVKYFINNYKAKYDMDQNMEKINIGSSIYHLIKKDPQLEKKLNSSKHLDLAKTALEVSQQPLNGVYEEEEKEKIAALSLGIIAKLVGADSMLKNKPLYRNSLKQTSTLPPEDLQTIVQACAKIILKPEHNELTTDTAITLGKMIGKSLRAELEQKMREKPYQEHFPSLESILAKDIIAPKFEATLVATKKIDIRAEPTPPTQGDKKQKDKKHGI
jgi:hypothetical protein